MGNIIWPIQRGDPDRTAGIAAAVVVVDVIELAIIYNSPTPRQHIVRVVKTGPVWRAGGRGRERRTRCHISGAVVISAATRGTR